MTTSPETSGNAGTTYETQVAAYYLSAVLVAGGVQGLDSATAKTVALQRQALGDPLDDIVIEGVRNDGSEAKLQLQAKTKLTISDAASNADFRAVIAASWAALGQSSFREGADRFGAVTQNIAMESYRNVRRLHEVALYSTDAPEYSLKLAAPGQLSAAAKKVRDIVVAVLEREAGRSITVQEEWRFFRHFLVLQIETGGEGARQRHSAVERLKQALASDDAGRAPDLFDALERQARAMNGRSGKVDARSLGDLLAGRFRLQRDVAPTSVEQITLQLREAARADLEGFKGIDLGAFGVPVRPAFVENPDDESATPKSLDDLSRMVAEGTSVMLQGQPGAGKSTALLHLAEEILERDDLAAPFVLPLQQYEGVGLLAELLRRPSLRQIPIERLEQMAVSGRLVLLCDAWNEVPVEGRTRVRTALDEFERNFPQSALVVASRTGGSHPLTEKRRHLWMSPLSRPQQILILSSLIDDGAEELLGRVDHAPGLSELLRIPFYLTAFGRMNPQGELPSTRGQLIAGLMEQYEARIGGRETLFAVTRGLHVDLLRSIGSRLVELGTTRIAEADLRAEIARASARLQAEGQIGQPFEPSLVIQGLIDHHVLARIPFAESPAYALPHEQIQEWLASFEVEAAYLAGSENKSVPFEFLDRFVDDRRWTEPTLFAIERMGRSPTLVPAAARIIAWTLGIDRDFAARMIARAGDLVWPIIGPVVTDYLSVWRSSNTPPDEEDAARFLSTCGRPELGGELWNLLEGDVGGHTLNHVDVANLYSMVREEWASRYAGLAAGQRRALLYDLVSWGPPDAVKLAISEAVRDPVFDVLYSVVNLLEHDRSEELDMIVDQIDPAHWPELAARVSLRGLEPGPFGERLISEKIKVVETGSGDDPIERLLLQLAEIGVEIERSRLVDLTLNAKRDHHYSVPVRPVLLSEAGAELSQALVERLENGEPISSEFAQYIRREDAPSQERLLEIGIKAKRPGDNRRVAAQLLEATMVERVLLDIIGLYKESAWTVAKREHYNALGDLITESRLGDLLSALERIAPADDTIIKVLAEWLFRWKQDRENETVTPDPSQQARLSALVTAWSDALLSMDAPGRGSLSNLAHTIGLFALHEHMPTLTNLARRNSELWERDQVEFQASLSQGRSQNADAARMSYTNIFRGAFAALGGAPEAEALITFLDDAHFGEDAAYGLQQHATDGLSTGRGNAHRLPHDQLPQRRLELDAAAQRAPNAIAAMLIERIERLVRTGVDADLSRAAQFTIALTQMNFGNRMDVFDLLLADVRLVPRSRLAILGGLQLRGATLRDDLVFGGLDDAIAEVLGLRWASDNEWWSVREWLRLVPSAEHPELLVDHLDRLPDHQKRPHKFDDLISALGHTCRPSALEALRRLSHKIPEIAHSYAWRRALVAIGTSAAFDELIDSAVAAASTVGKFGDGFADAVEQFVASQPALADRLLDRQDWQSHDRMRAALGHALVRQLDEKTALRLFDLARVDRPDPLREELERGVGDLGIMHVPVGGSSGMREIVPRSAMKFRATMLAEVNDGGAKAALATRLLVRLDKSRSYYGRPSDEPRHPDLAKNIPWPSFAASAWAAAQNI